MKKEGYEYFAKQYHNLADAQIMQKWQFLSNIYNLPLAKSEIDAQNCQRLFYGRNFTALEVGIIFSRLLDQGYGVIDSLFKDIDADRLGPFELVLMMCSFSKLHHSNNVSNVSEVVATLRGKVHENLDAYYAVCNFSENVINDENLSYGLQALGHLDFCLYPRLYDFWVNQIVAPSMLRPMFKQYCTDNEAVPRLSYFALNAVAKRMSSNSKLKLAYMNFKETIFRSITNGITDSSLVVAVDMQHLCNVSRFAYLSLIKNIFVKREDYSKTAFFRFFKKLSKDFNMLEAMRINVFNQIIVRFMAIELCMDKGYEQVYSLLLPKAEGYSPRERLMTKDLVLNSGCDNGL